MSLSKGTTASDDLREAFLFAKRLRGQAWRNFEVADATLHRLAAGGASPQTLAEATEARSDAWYAFQRAQRDWDTAREAYAASHRRPKPATPPPLGPPLSADDLRDLRIAAGLSQRQLAELMGRSLQTISRWERGLWPIPPKESDNLRELLEPAD